MSKIKGKLGKKPTSFSSFAWIISIWMTERLRHMGHSMRLSNISNLAEEKIE